MRSGTAILPRITNEIGNFLRLPFELLGSSLLFVGMGFLDVSDTGTISVN